MTEFFIASPKRTLGPREHGYISFWRPDDKGYAWPLSWAGRYGEEAVRDSEQYYSDGVATLAVPCDLVEAIAMAPRPGDIDGNVGPVVLNIPENWAYLRQHALIVTTAGCFPGDVAPQVDKLTEKQVDWLQRIFSYGMPMPARTGRRGDVPPVVARALENGGLCRQIMASDGHRCRRTELTDKGIVALSMIFAGRANPVSHLRVAL